MLQATLPCSLTITGTLLDTGIDQAVYVPAAGGHPAFIAGVRGGYVLKFDPVTGAYQSAARFCSPNFGDGAICYDYTNDKLIASFWNEQSSKTNPATDPHDARGLYKINPTDLSVELFVSSASVGTPIPQCIHNIAYYAGPGPDIDHTMIYCLMVCQPSIGTYDPVTFAPINRSGYPIVAEPYYPIWNDIAVVTGNPVWTDGITGMSGGNFYGTDPINQLIQVYIEGGSSIYTNTDVVSPTSGNFSAYGICALPGSTVHYQPNIDLYVSTLRGGVYFLATTYPTSNPWTPISLPNTPGVTPMMYHIRYNPNDGLIYAPDVAGGAVFVIKATDVWEWLPPPSQFPDGPGTWERTGVTHSVVSTTYGLDSPIDVVFTPNGVFAVQQGLTGLKRLY